MPQKEVLILGSPFIMILINHYFNICWLSSNPLHAWCLFIVGRVTLINMTHSLIWISSVFARLWVGVCKLMKGPQRRGVFSSALYVTLKQLRCVLVCVLIEVRIGSAVLSRMRLYWTGSCSLCNNLSLAHSIMQKISYRKSCIIINSLD